MELNQSTAKSWSRMQVYGFLVICLLLGICAWYLAYASSVLHRAQESAATAASTVTLTPEQWKQLADTQAEPLLARLQRSPDDAVLLAEIAKIYFQTRQYSVATKYYEDSIRIKPNGVVLVKLGGAYHFAGDNDKAIGAWNRALSLDPNNPDALFNIGFVKWKAQGDREGALAAWQKLLKTNPNHPKRAQVKEMIVKAEAAQPELPMGNNN